MSSLGGLGGGGGGQKSSATATNDLGAFVARQAQNVTTGVGDRAFKNIIAFPGSIQSLSDPINQPVNAAGFDVKTVALYIGAALVGLWLLKRFSNV